MRLGGEATHLGIASRGGEVTFHRATVRELSGPGVFSASGKNTGAKEKVKKDTVTLR